MPSEVVLSDSHKGLGSVLHFMECCKKSIGSRSPIGVPTGAVMPNECYILASVWCKMGIFQGCLETCKISATQGLTRALKH